jgi:RNA polymerase sigma-70 factor (ECF subfamily)
VFDLSEIYDAHAPALYGFLLNLTRNEADSQDALQEVFVRIARKPGCLTEVRDLRAFLFRMAHHAAVDQTRNRASRSRTAERAALEPADLFASTPDPDAAFLRKRVADALQELPEEQRAVVHLKLWEDLTFVEIAGVLDIPANTAASRYRYAIEKLGTHLRPLLQS